MRQQLSVQDSLGDQERRAAAALAVQRLMGALGVEDSEEEEEGASEDGGGSDDDSTVDRAAVTN
jgi:hypothetical protein